MANPLNVSNEEDEYRLQVQANTTHDELSTHKVTEPILPTPAMAADNNKY